VRFDQPGEHRLREQRLGPVIVSNPLSYGMARMWSLMAGEMGVTVQPFYEVSEAGEWLGLPQGYRPGLFSGESLDESSS
jgi:hypothetical protein